MKDEMKIEQFVYCEASQLESLTGIGRSNWNSYFLGTHSMTLKQRDRICNALQMSNTDFEKAFADRSRICRQKANIRDQVNEILEQQTLKSSI